MERLFFELAGTCKYRNSGGFCSIISHMSAIRPIGLLGRRIINRLLSGPVKGKRNITTTFNGPNLEIAHLNTTIKSIAEISRSAQIENLLDVSSIIKSGKEYRQFRFNNGVRIVVMPKEEKISVPTPSARFPVKRIDQNSYFRVVELNINCGGKEVDLMAHGLSSVCDHFISFGNAGPYYYPQSIVVNEKGKEIGRHRPLIVICAPLNTEGNAYDGESLLYHWVHEFGHALAMRGRSNKYLYNSGDKSFKLIEHLPFGVKQERDADAIGVKILRWMIRSYGETTQGTIAKFVASAEGSFSLPDLAGLSLCDRAGLNKDFDTAYSDRSRALFRKEGREIKKSGISDANAIRKFQIDHRRQENISGLKAKYDGSAETKYDAMVNEWVGENRDEMIKSSRIMDVFDRYGYELERVEDEIDQSLEYNFHTSVMLKSGIPWERYRNL
jgi:hypothetical protein